MRLPSVKLSLIVAGSLALAGAGYTAYALQAKNAKVAAT
jgi:hypothetical protein